MHSNLMSDISTQINYHLDIELEEKDTNNVIHRAFQLFFPKETEKQKNKSFQSRFECKLIFFIKFNQLWIRAYMLKGKDVKKSEDY